MVEHWLNEINDIPGVSGTFIATARARIIKTNGLKLEAKKLEELTLRLLRISALFNEKDEEVTELELFWQEQFIVCRMAENLLLITICQNPKILPLLRITMNVSISHILQDKKMKKVARSNATDKTLHLRKGSFEQEELKLLSNI